MTHTIETVKRDLPKVTIRLMSGKIIEGNVSGRRNKFASVWIKDNHEGWEFTWQTIVNALNNDRPLRVL
jgi:hypothetical protein